MAEDYEKMTVAELKVLLKEAGLPISGKKADLIERLSASEEVEKQSKKLRNHLMMVGKMTMRTTMMTTYMSQSKSPYFQMI